MRSDLTGAVRIGTTKDDISRCPRSEDATYQKVSTNHAVIQPPTVWKILPLDLAATSHWMTPPVAIAGSVM